MTDKPSTEQVCQLLDALYLGASADASKYLEQIQNSVFGWEIADVLLKLDRNEHSSYFAACTMKYKIKEHFDEIPVESHNALKESLINNVLNLTNANKATTMQLALALADLAILSPSWTSVVDDFINKFSTDLSCVPFLLLLLTLLPEELMFNENLQVKQPRWDDCKKSLTDDITKIFHLLSICLEKFPDDENILIKIFECIASWLTLGDLPIEELSKSPLLMLPFQAVSQATTSEEVFEAATECISSQAYSVDYTPEFQSFSQQLSENIMALRPVFQACKEVDDFERSKSLAKCFMSYLDSYLAFILKDPDSGFGNMSSLELLVDCINHGNIKIGEMTFDIWDNLAELLERIPQPELIEPFKPIFRRLMVGMWRLCQYNKDTPLNAILNEDHNNDFIRFRTISVYELMHDVMWIYGELETFQEMFQILLRSDNTWTESESALFIMHIVADELRESQSELIGQLVHTLLSLQDNCHPLVKRSAIKVLHHLSDWINSHQETIDPVIRFMIASLRNDRIKSAAASGIQSICFSCQKKIHISHFEGLFQVLQSSEELGLANESVIVILKALGSIISHQPADKYESLMSNVVALQVKPLHEILVTQNTGGPGTKNDPCIWLDRLSSIFRTSVASFPDIHPAASIVKELWPLFAQVLEKYQLDARVTERTCRALRFMLRCVQTSVPEVLPPLITIILNLFTTNKHSCFLYLGSIIVDEYGGVVQYHQILTEMFTTFVHPCFEVFSEEGGVIRSPDTVDDFFRLCGRFLQKCPSLFLSLPYLQNILTLSSAASKIGHREACLAILKFYKDFVKTSFPGAKITEARTEALTALNANGQSMIDVMVFGLTGDIPSRLSTELADCLWSFLESCRNETLQWIRFSLERAPDVTPAGLPVRTDAKQKFFTDTEKCQDASNFSSICRSLSGKYNA